MLDPHRTVALVLGASEWPNYPERFTSSLAFTKSANGFSKYLQDTAGLSLPDRNVQDLFDSTDEVTAQYDRMANFLRARLTEMDTPAGNGMSILIYYVGHGAFFGPEKAYCLLVRATRSPIEADTSIRLTTLAGVLRTIAPLTKEGGGADN